MTNTCGDQPVRISMAFSDGRTFTATLLWSRAPLTCAAVVHALPTIGEARHAQWAGEEIMFTRFPVGRIPPIENHFVWQEPGYSLTNKHSGGVLAFYPNPQARSLCVLYGEVVPRSGADTEVAVSVFATIDQPDVAKSVGRGIRANGSMEARISIVQASIRGG